MLDDGEYDAIVVDATDADDGVIVLELTILAGAHKGQMVELRATGLGRDPLDLLAEPCTVTVRDGQPSVSLG